MLVLALLFLPVRGIYDFKSTEQKSSPQAKHSEFVRKNRRQFGVCLGYEKVTSMRLDSLIETAVTGLGHINPFNQLWNLIMVCALL